jgi:hypothetical protein
VSRNDDLSGDMPKLPWTRNLDPSTSDAGLEALLSGDSPPPDAPAEMRLLADMLGALAAPGTAEEYRGSGRVYAAFRERFGMSQRHRQAPRRWGWAVLATALGTKLFAGTAAAAVGIGGVAAAYAGALPDPVQNVAHALIGAPHGNHGHGHGRGNQPAAPSGTDESGSATKSATPVGPDPTGPAAFGLCTAYSSAKAAGTPISPTSVAFKNLATAAGGADKIEAFCAKVPHPGSGAAHRTTPPSHATGKPTAHPTGRPSTTPGGSAGHAATTPATPSRPTEPTVRPSR